MSKKAFRKLSSGSMERILNAIQMDGRSRSARGVLMNILNDRWRAYVELKRELPGSTPTQALSDFDKMEDRIRRLDRVLPAKLSPDDSKLRWLCVVARKKESLKPESAEKRLIKTISRVRSDLESLCELVQFTRDCQKKNKRNKKYENLVFQQSLFGQLIFGDTKGLTAEDDFIASIGSLYGNFSSRPFTWNKNKIGSYDGPAVRFARLVLLECCVNNPRTGKAYTQNQIGERWNKWFTKNPSKEGVVPVKIRS